jgi:zinc transport system substrate-binding protein
MCFALPVNAADQNTQRKQVLTTIKPLQLLVKAIAGDRLDVEVLLQPQQSPHHYQLRPSDRARLASAAQVYWIGAGMETFLARTALALPAGQLQTLGKSLAVAEDHHDHGHHHDDAGISSDPHLWLDYQQIVQMSEAIEQGLSLLSPADAAQFAANRQQFVRQLEQLDRQAASEFLAYQNRGFIMSHAAYGRLLAHYGLAGGMALSDEHGQVAGAKRWQSLEKFMAEQSPKCFMRDPSEHQTIEDTFLQRYPMQVVDVDTMGIAIAPAPGGFVEFYRGLTASVAGCLKIAKGI